MNRQKEVTTKKKRKNFLEYIFVFVINSLLYLMFKYESLCSCVCLHHNVQRRPAIMFLDKTLGHASVCFHRDT